MNMEIKVIYALLVLNNDILKNCRIMVQVRGKKLKTRVFHLLKTDKWDKAFDILVSEAEVRTYLPKETPPPRTPLLITLDEERIKGKPQQVENHVQLTHK